MDIEFVDSLPDHPGKRGEVQRFLEAVRTGKGKWAKRPYKSAAVAASTASAIRRRAGYEAAARGADLYVRYVGD